MSSDSDSGNDDGSLFYFESDHLAVRGNRDYSNLLRTVIKLQAQREQVHHDLEELELAKKRYLEDPELLLQKLRNKEEVVACKQIKVAELPELSIQLPEEMKIKPESATTSEQANIVRGRLFDESKPETFNQLWTCDEQRRLEELLIEYPVEPIEMRRFAKIARALGNRTPQQVASRVQKYFKKLYDAGMPIPGRIPKNRRGGQSKFRNLYRPTTFFPAHNVSVPIPDDDFMPDLNDVQPPQSTKHNTVNCGEQVESKEQILYMLEVIREEKRSLCDGYIPDPMAPKCDNCHSAPISSTCWRCYTCYCRINQCCDCIISQLLSREFEHLGHEVVVENDK